MPKILLIDDDPLVRELITGWLRKSGQTVIACENGKKGIEQAAQDFPDLVITDVYMPETDGLEVIRTIRYRIPNILIIAISGGGIEGSPNYLEVAKEFGANAVLQKPFTPDELMALISELLK